MTLLRRYAAPAKAAALAAVLAAGLAGGPARAASTSIDFYFPTPVQGPLARELTRIVKEFNDKNPDIEVVPVYTGSYDDTRLKAQAAIAAGKPPGVALMSANFVLEFVLNKQIEPIEDYLVENKIDPKTYLDDFWPAVRPNAVIDGKIYAIPYQNSTPLLYLNAEQFREVGLDPEKPPATWAELVADAEKLTKRQTLVLGLASFTQASEGAAEWGLIAAGTLLVTLPLIIAFVAFQRQFVNSFMSSGIK